MINNSTIENIINNESSAFCRLLGFKDKESVINIYIENAELIQNYTKNLIGEPVYFEFGESNFRFNSKVYYYNEISGIRLISSVYYLASNFSKNKDSEYEKMYNFVCSCLDEAKINNKGIPIDIDYPSVRHWVKNTFYSSKKTARYVLSDELGNKARLTKPIKIKMD